MIFLEVADDNAAAIALYARGRLRSWSASGRATTTAPRRSAADALVMRLNLTS